MLSTNNSVPIHILIVDDSEDDFELCLHFLRHEFLPTALRVESEIDFRQALVGQEWDAVLYDYSLPQFSVFGALQIMRELEIDIPFIVVSGSVSEEDAVQCIKTGAHDYLIKDRLTKLPYTVKREIREARAREEYRVQEMLNKQLFKELHDFRSALNVSSLTSITSLDGTILSVNELFCNASGYSEDELVGANHRILNSDYHTRDFWQDVWRTILSGKIWRGDIRNRAKDGTYYWVDITIYPIVNAEGELYRFMSISHIITEQKEAALRVAESEVRFRTLADTAPVLIWMADTNGLRFYFNTSWLEFTGKTIEEEIGDGWVAHIHPEDLARYMDVYTKSFAEQQKFTIEYRLQHHSEEYRWMLAISVPRYLPDGTFAGYMGSCVDISQRKEAEKYLLQMNEDLEQRVADRTKTLIKLNEEKNEFLGIAAHDLKNPLSGIRTSAEIILRYFNENEKASTFVSRIIESSDQMLDIITKLLDVNKIESGDYTLHCTPISLDALDKQVQSYQVRAAQKAIILSYEPIEARVYADTLAMHQIFDNLISNAIKYSPEWSKIWVRTLRLANESGNPVIRIEIQDEGPGLTENDKAKLFTKFARLSAKPTGKESSTGLGLSIVKRLVEAMNGQVWCESEHGKGATFIVELQEAITT